MQQLYNQIKNYPKAIPFIAGLIITIILGWFVVKKLMDCSTKKMDEPPPGMSNNLWNELTSLKDGGKYIGNLERILFYIAFWYDKPILIGGILTFKVAAKWEAWKNIVQVPERKLNGFIDDTSYFIFRRQWGSKLLTRFLVGTFSNILIAFVGYGIYKFLSCP